MGFDPNSAVSEEGERIVRRVSSEIEEHLRILQRCEEKRLFDQGLIPTRVLVKPSRENEPLILEHPRIPFVSYPHEWCTAMFQDAAIFQLEFNQLLIEQGMTLKDSHPWNIVFQGVRPFFVDFSSLISRDRLNREEWLGTFSRAWMKRIWDQMPVASKYFYESYRRMFFPYFYFPLLMMKRKRTRMARQVLLETTINTSDRVIDWMQAGGPLWIINFMSEVFRAGVLIRGRDGELCYLDALKKEISSWDVKSQKSKYVKYYEQKKENVDLRDQSSWGVKQKSVYELLQKASPKSVMDLACNTGWFSILAAKMGASVVGVDIDEECVNRLYDHAKSLGLQISPFIMNVLTPTLDNFSTSGSSDGQAVLKSADKRFKCEMVMVLALVHHLCLGEGVSLDRAVSIFSAYSNRYLIVEFVPLDDPLIQGEKSFFKAYQSNPEAFSIYRLDAFKSALAAAQFRILTEKPSHPEGRVLILAERAIS